MSLNPDQDISDENFKRLYFEYYSVAHRTAIYILKNQDAAEDVAQNVFLKLWDKRNQLSDLNNPKAYIAQMARNGALDTLKKDDNLGEEYIPLEFVDHAADNGSQSEEMRVAIERAVAQLSPKCRLVFSLSRFEGLTNPEIAEHLDVSIRTVETQISNALKLFRTDLRHYFIEFLGWGILIGYYLIDQPSNFIF
ncbi:MAG: RNA polymerase sigma-70 factor [Reichenbachiella sp.]|uniref:RNA polymerase sigma-70 factor n=1 Tax=Reichenbachiella sp. TaxID=2184521 RepID=UPI003262E842